MVKPLLPQISASPLLPKIVQFRGGGESVVNFTFWAARFLPLPLRWFRRRQKQNGQWEKNWAVKEKLQFHGCSLKGKEEEEEEAISKIFPPLLLWCRNVHSLIPTTLTFNLKLLIDTAWKNMPRDICCKFTTAKKISLRKQDKIIFRVARRQFRPSGKKKLLWHALNCF